MAGPFAGKQVSFLTMHGKEHLLRGPLESALGCQLIHTAAYDTDQLGSFSRTTPRVGTQLDAARKKARIGMQLLGTRQGIASEGSFVADPYVGLMPWNVECCIWIDDDLGLEVVGIAQGPARNAQKAVASVAELEEFARQAEFPSHHLMLRPGRHSDSRIIKGVCDDAALRAAFATCKSQSDNGLVFVEHDLRAFCNPTRQGIIRQAADVLVSKLTTCCPACGTPGWEATTRLPGLPCQACASPTRMTRAEIWRCQKCAHEMTVPVAAGSEADPSRCDVCNP